MDVMIVASGFFSTLACIDWNLLIDTHESILRPQCMHDQMNKFLQIRLRLGRV